MAVNTSIIECNGCGNAIFRGDRISVISEGTFAGIENGEAVWEEEAGDIRCESCTETMKESLITVIETVVSTAVAESLAPRPGDEYPMDDEREFEHPGESGCCGSCDDLIKPMTATVDDMEVEVVDP